VSQMGSRSSGVLARSLVFTVLVPGTVTVVAPYLLLPRGAGLAIGPAGLWGVPLIALGMGCYFWCVWDFALRGGGTPAPIDAPKRLVVTGPYRYVRNPMYLGVESLVVGEAILFSSWRLLEYAGLLAVCFHLFVVLYEERTLRKKFGMAYDGYCRTVSRWVPKRPSRQT